MSNGLVIARTALIALVSAFVAFRLGYYFADRGFAELELFDYLVAIPAFVMSIILLAVCIKALLRATTT